MYMSHTIASTLFANATIASYPGAVNPASAVRPSTPFFKMASALPAPSANSAAALIAFVPIHPATSANFATNHQTVVANV